MARRMLFDALSARYGGGAHAAAQLSSHLAAHPEVDEIGVVTRRGSIVDRSLAHDSAVRRVTLPAARRAELARRVAWEARSLPALLARERSDVLITMMGLPVRHISAPVVCLLGNPVMYERDTPANRLRRWVADRTARESAVLAAPSRHMAELVRASAGRPCDVLPWGVDHELFRPGHEVAEDVLCVGDMYAHKRFDLVLDAWRELRAPRPRLRLIGNPAVDPDTYARIQERIGRLPEREAVSLEGRVRVTELVRAYQRARVFVVASEHESFCMPLAEAMACGAVPVSRDIESLRETGGPAAVYVDGDDPVRWSAAIARLLDDDVAHARAREAAIAQAAGFSWSAWADALMAQL